MGDIHGFTLDPRTILSTYKEVGHSIGRAFLWGISFGYVKREKRIARVGEA
jgi:hypothetical protein